MVQKSARDERIAEIARRQHGAISIRQLNAAGIGSSAVRKRCQAGRLHRLHRGVYAVGHVAPSLERRWMAAVLALGDGAVLSHLGAAALWRLLTRRGGPVDVSLPSRDGRRKRVGIRVHRPESLEPQHSTKRLGIPVTTPERTLRDLRGAVSPGELRRAVRQAEFLGLPTGPDIAVDHTRSELERRFLLLCRRHRLPEPEVNRRIGQMTVDFCWAGRRLIVETDGFQSHAGRQAFEDDRARELRLRRFGYEVLHLSYRQVVDEPAETAAAIRAALADVGRFSAP